MWIINRLKFPNRSIAVVAKRKDVARALENFIQFSQSITEVHIRLRIERNFIKVFFRDINCTNIFYNIFFAVQSLYSFSIHEVFHLKKQVFITQRIKFRLNFNPFRRNGNNISYRISRWILCLRL